MDLRLVEQCLRAGRRGALVPACAALACAVLACAKSDATGPGGGTRVTVFDAPPGPAWNGTASAVTVGTRANCLLSTDNTVWCWGNTRGGDLRIDIGLRNVPQWQNIDGVIDSICYAKRTGGVEYPVGWPCNVFKPVRLSTRTFSSITLGMREEPLCGIDAGGTPYCWDQEPMTSTTPDSVTNGGSLEWCGRTLCLFAPQPMRTSQKLARFAPNSTLCALSTSGTVLCRGTNYKSLMGNRGISFFSDTLVPVLGAPPASAITASPDGYFGCAIATATLRVWCWGESLYGAVGNGTFSETVSTPTLTSSTLGFKALVSTLGGNCGLTTAGLAYCWGDGRVGQIGWGGYGWSTTPVAVSGNRAYTQITAGPGHVCALDAGGAAWCWGDNYYGQLGAGRPACTNGPSTSCSTVPVAVQGGLTFRQIAAGIAHTCGVTTGNELYCWGWTNYGRLGLQPLVTEWIATPTRITP
jgi:hypothetical protein